MAQPSEHARLAGRAFRDHEHYNGAPGFWSWSPNVVTYYDDELLKRDANGQIWIRWPEEVHPQRRVTLRAVLNGLLRGLFDNPQSNYPRRVIRPYTFSLTDGKPFFWMLIHGKWQNQHFTPGAWIPIAEGELARLAVREAHRAGAQPYA